MSIYYAILALVGIICIVATLMIGNSQSNKDESDRYTKDTKGNIMRLVWLNVIWGAVMVVYMMVA
jgi:hypothetical protein